jgi:hypothetical protein
MKHHPLVSHLPLRTYESNRFLGAFGPVPFASVELSEQWKEISTVSEFNKKSSELAALTTQAYLDYRFGRIQSANSNFKLLVNNPNNDTTLKEFAFLGAAITSTLQKDYAESNELLAYVSKHFSLAEEDKRAATYWRMRNALGLQSESSLIDDLWKVSEKEASWQLFELYQREKDFNKSTASKLRKFWKLERDGSYAGEKWTFLIENETPEECTQIFHHDAFALDHKTMLAYLDRYGIDLFRSGWRSQHGAIPYTSEILAALSLFSAANDGPAEFKELYTASRVLHLGNLSITQSQREKLVADSVTSPFGIRDFNTSNFGGRTYTLDLAGSDQFQWLEKDIRDAVAARWELLSTDLSPFALPPVDDLSIWFDASFTSGGSNIFPHLHTAGLSQTYHFTLVFYAQVPHDMREGEGDLIFTDTDIPDPKYKKSPISNRVRVESGDLYAFPSYYFHSTTPSFTRQVRLTFNFDFMTGRKSMPIVL